MNKKIFAAVMLVMGVASANAVKLMDQMHIATTQSYFTGNGNHEDGSGLFGAYLDLRCADDFKVSSGTWTLTSVKVGNVGFGGGNALARVRIYADAGGLPGATIHSGTFAITSVPFADTIFGLVGNIHTADVSAAGWVLGPGHYWVNMQTVSASDWEYTVRGALMNGFDSALGDGPNGQGGYGFGLWRSAGAAGFGAGDSAYEINAVPEPATMIALGLGAAAMIRRRRK